MAFFVMFLLMLAIIWLLWMNYQTLDGFNEDLKQLRLLVGNIERGMAKDCCDTVTKCCPSKTE